MKYFALATDYDGTLALHGKVDEPTVAALDRVRASGRRLIMVTGRELDELATVCPYLDRFDLIVAENGALLFDPKTREHTPLGDPPPHKFVETLIARGVGPISVGRAIVATWEPHETTVLQTIHELGLELQVIFNKGAVMVLPSGVNKATGLQAALHRLCLSPHNIVGIGDAENDHAFLSYCECGVAVANALPITKEYADWVTEGDHGSGVIELADRLLAEDLATLEDKVGGRIELGKQHDGALASVPAYGVSMLIAGTSGAGKSTLSTGLVERLASAAYQFCIIDPEGDYEGFENVVVLGDAKRVPGLEEVRSVLEDPTHNLVVNLLGVKLDDRPAFFASLWAELHKLRERVGRPHWIILDEAHHILPAVKELKGKDLQATLLITVHPEQLPPTVHGALDLVVAIGAHPGETLATVARGARKTPPTVTARNLAPGEAIGWWTRADAAFEFSVTPPRSEHRRHIRKYAQGSLSEDESFYFRGPGGKLNLRAQNLQLFLQIADGVDDETWRHHLQRGEYSQWFRGAIKDNDLAEEAQKVERDESASPQQSRQRMRELIEARYTTP
jgi:HAD superfamily hydrolase (TIGR01484 family)